MKAQLLFVFLLLLSNLSLHAQDECILQGSVKGLSDGTLISLYRGEEMTLSPFDTDTVKSEKFFFKVKTEKNNGAEHVMLIARGEGFPNNMLDLYLLPGKTVTITGKNKLLCTWDVASDILEQEQQNIFVNANRKYLDRWQELTCITTALWKRIDTLQSKRDRDVLGDSIRYYYYPLQDSLQTLITKKELELMKDMPINTVWLNKLRDACLHAVYEKDSILINEAKIRYEMLTPEQRESTLGKQISVQLFPYKKVEVGNELYDADLYDPQGYLHHLKDYKGKYLLLDFWSSSCGPCINAIPEMREMAEIWKDKLTIISISSDNKKMWEKASQEEKMTWPNLNDFKGTVGIYAHYGIRGIPHYVLASPEGKLIHVWEGYGKGNIQMKLKEWIK